mgnify:CR=1 FL=1
MNGADIRFVHLGITINHLKSSISVFGFRIAFYGIIIGIGMLAGLYVMSIWFLGGLQLIAIGMVGQYIGKIYLETKARPKFIIEQVLND